ncbi:hypothetical protein [Brachyspira hampsonii]|uniref:Peptidase M30, hyicolysin n=1 Tax=Brachyspira hampsonii TaxID=1287055 RepID=A0AAC9TR33_9SPIR|nr:hypothetical protein [Brachyspira hampsonii]ASJ20275.1 hypothetical protein BHAMNSH16_00810 [Brachyspira hampsonii]ELV04742.1 hypothetical protein H263_14393 [Brachyspira hampsonii 30599]OEJ16400.1 hypothetical protein A9496_01625 [Brachyspira hampsonii]
MKKLLFIYLTIAMTFIVSCSNKVLNPSESIDGITYYDPNNAEISKFNAIVFIGADLYSINTEFKKIAESDNAIIYIQNGQSFDMNNVKKLFTKFEANYDEEIRIYGEPISFPSINDDKMVFLIYNFYPNSEPGDFAGFFYGADLFDYEATVNKGKYMYININGINNPDAVVGTMLHEFQHLINASVNLINSGNEMDLWLNESLSESTSVLFEPLTADSRIRFFNRFPYYSFFSWKINEIIGNINTEKSSINSLYFSYCSSSVFMRWINHIGGKEAIRAIAHSSPSLDSKTRLVNSVQSLNIGNSVEEIFISWIKDIYKDNLTDVKVQNIPFDTFVNSLSDPSKGLPLAPGGFIIYDADEYDLNNQEVKTEVLDSQNNIYLAWNGNFNSVSSLGEVNPNDVIWINAINISSSASSLSKSEMFSFDYFKYNKIYIDKVLTPEEVMKAKSKE